MKIIGIVLLIILAILYMAVLPLAKKHYQKKQLAELDNFINDLTVGDQVILNSGIVGKIARVEDYLFHINISKDTVVRIDKHSVLGRFEEK